jgi:hypothetical protein
MKRIILVLSLIAGLFVTANAQSFGEGNVLITGTTGGIFPKGSDGKVDPDFLLGVETNWFVGSSITATVGFDYYVQANSTSLSLGTRLYPTNSLYFRYKSNIDPDFSHVNTFMLGLGYDYFLSDAFVLEIGGDYHIDSNSPELRFGLAINL